MNSSKELSKRGKEVSSGMLHWAQHRGYRPLFQANQAIVPTLHGCSPVPVPRILQEMLPAPLQQCPASQEWKGEGWGEAQASGSRCEWLQVGSVRLADAARCGSGAASQPSVVLTKGSHEPWG